MKANPSTIVPWFLVALLVLVVLGPIWGQWRTAVLGPFGGVDAVLQAGILEWSGRHWWQPTTWTQLPIFFPAPHALAFMDSLLGQALLVWPLRVLPGMTPAALYNLAFLLSLLLAASGFAALWRACGGAWTGAAFGALVLLGSPYTTSQLGHLNQLPPGPLLWGLAALVLARRRTAVSGGRADSTLKPAARMWWCWAGLLIVQAAWGWYGFAQFAGASLLLLLEGLWRGRREGWARPLVRSCVSPLLLAMGVVLVLAVPYWQASRAFSGFERSAEEVRVFSADLKHFLNHGAYRPTVRDYLGRGERGLTRYAGKDRQVLHPGWVALGMGLAGFWFRRRLPRQQRRDGVLLLMAGAVGLLMAFGDSVGVPGGSGRMPLPLGTLQDLLPPLRAFRAVTRFAFIGFVAVAWWAAVTYELWCRQSGWRVARPLAALGLAALLWLESAPAGIPGQPLPSLAVAFADSTVMPSCAVLTLPAPPDEAGEDLMEAGWLFRSLAHGQAVTGGVSGWVPPFTRRLRSELARHETTGAPPDSLLNELRTLGIETVELATDEQGRWKFWAGQLRRLGYRQHRSVPGYTLFLPPPLAAAGLTEH